MPRKKQQPPPPPPQEWPLKKTYRLEETAHIALIEIMAQRGMKTENEGINYVLQTYLGMEHQLRIVTAGLNSAEAEIEEFGYIKDNLRQVLTDLGILAPDTEPGPSYSRITRDEEE